MAEYQLPSDAFDGVARSGVIRGDGKWIPCEAGNPDWYEYVKWLEASPDNNPEPFRRVEHGGVAIKLEDDQSAVGSMVDSVEQLDMPPPAEVPRRIPHRADLYTPPPGPKTDASRSPTREQRSDSYRPLSEEERTARAQAPTEGVWTQDQVDADRARRERDQQAGQGARPHQPTHAHDDAQRHTTQAHPAAHDDKEKKDDNKKK